MVIVVVCVTRQNAPFKQCTIPLASKWLQKVHHWWANVLVRSFHSTIHHFKKKILEYCEPFQNISIPMTLLGLFCRYYKYLQSFSFLNIVYSNFKTEFKSLYICFPWEEIYFSKDNLTQKNDKSIIIQTFSKS